MICYNQNLWTLIAKPLNYLNSSQVHYKKSNTTWKTATIKLQMKEKKVANKTMKTIVKEIFILTYMISVYLATLSWNSFISQLQILSKKLLQIVHNVI